MRLLGVTDLEVLTAFAPASIGSRCAPSQADDAKRAANRTIGRKYPFVSRISQVLRKRRAFATARLDRTYPSWRSVRDRADR
jgi:hypothetical protein